MTLFVKVENNEVTQVWDTPPPVGEADWRQAVEVRPSINFEKQCYTEHTFDLSKNPVEIVWGTRDMTFDERKANIRSKVKHAFEIVVNAELRKQLDKFPETQYDASVVDAARIEYESKMSALNEATTHEHLDALI